jgi:hypothetical protein
MWILQLNDMRGRTENFRQVARGESKEALQAWVEREKVETYDDGIWRKSFPVGHPLEWCNTPWDEGMHFPHYVDVGTLDEAVQGTIDDWNGIINRLPEAL